MKYSCVYCGLCFYHFYPAAIHIVYLNTGLKQWPHKPHHFNAFPHPNPRTKYYTMSRPRERHIALYELKPVTSGINSDRPGRLTF